MKGKAATPRAESVEEFIKRGGKVTRLAPDDRSFRPVTYLGEGCLAAQQGKLGFDVVLLVDLYVDGALNDSEPRVLFIEDEDELLEFLDEEDPPRD
jgi:hypothetical protein